MLCLAPQRKLWQWELPVPSSPTCLVHCTFGRADLGTPLRAGCSPSPGTSASPPPTASLWPALGCLCGKAQHGPGREKVLTIVLLAVFLHVNLVVALGWLAVGVTVCRGRTELSTEELEACGVPYHRKGRGNRVEGTAARPSLPEGGGYSTSQHPPEGS